MNEGENIYSLFIRSKNVTFPSVLAFILSVLAVTTTIYHLYTALFGQPPALVYRSISFNLFVCAALLYFPLNKRPLINQRFRTLIPDIVLFLFVIFIQVYILYDFDSLLERRGSPTGLDIVLGTIYIGIVIDVTRRTIGRTLTLLILFFFIHSFLSHHFFGFLYGPPVSYSELIDYLFLQEEGIFGIPIMVVADYIYLFILFGVFLTAAGAGKFFMDLAFALTKNQVGGPAKASVISSMLMATVSGSSGANVAITGQFTIPLMKKAGFRNDVAGAIEAVASTGGQIMPPVMGTTAFIMVYLLGRSYLSICLIALLPAVLYFFSVFVMVHFEAHKKKLIALNQGETVDIKNLLLKKGYMLLPILVIIAILVLGLSATMAAFYGIIAIFLISYIEKENRIGPDKFMMICVAGLKSCISIAAACGGVGILIGSLYVSGLGVKISSMILLFGEHGVLLTLCVTMIVSIILGMGLPTVVVYITLSTMVIPGLVDLGVNEAAAHFFCFYFGVIGCITPPVAISAFIGAGIADASFMRTGVMAMKIGIASYIIPYLFAHYPELLFEGGLTMMVFWRFALATISIFSIAVFVQGFLFSETGLVGRIIFGVVAAMLFIGGPILELSGIVLFVSGLFLMRRRSLISRKQSALIPNPE